jgi:hypothetical protein
LGNKKLEEELIKYQVEMGRRDRMGPFLGQIIQNTNCLFEDAASTQASTASMTGGGLIEVKTVVSHGGISSYSGFTSEKRPASLIYQQKLVYLKNQALQLEARLHEQEQMGSQEEENLPPNPDAT